ncbi:MAG: hypothetical protein R2880_08755 [Deinococcales bacterium]
MSFMVGDWSLSGGSFGGGSSHLTKHLGLNPLITGPTLLAFGISSAQPAATLA